MIRVLLLAICTASVFVALASWIYLVLSFALWMLVFGDTSSTFGYYALAIAVPLSLTLSAVFLGVAIRRPLSRTSLIGAIVISAVLEVLFVISISS